MTKVKTHVHGQNQEYGFFTSLGMDGWLLFTTKHVTPLGEIIPILSQPVFADTPIKMIPS